MESTYNDGGVAKRLLIAVEALVTDQETPIQRRLASATLSVIPLKEEEFQDGDRETFSKFIASVTAGGAFEETIAGMSEVEALACAVRLTDLLNNVLGKLQVE